LYLTKVGGMETTYVSMTNPPTNQLQPTPPTDAYLSLRVTTPHHFWNKIESCINKEDWYISWKENANLEGGRGDEWLSTLSIARKGMVKYILLAAMSGEDDDVFYLFWRGRGWVPIAGWSCGRVRQERGLRGGGRRGWCEEWARRG
jgi:hypothetical protein